MGLASNKLLILTTLSCAAAAGTVSIQIRKTPEIEGNAR